MRTSRTVPALIAAILFCFCTVGARQAFPLESGTVFEIVDGDTIMVRVDGESRAVRLIGIDAPERAHPSKPKEFLADESAAFLASLCEGKTVHLESDIEDADRYGRLLRYVFLPPPDGRMLNLEMVREGYARAYSRFPFGRRREIDRAEAEARAQGKGVWRDGGMAELRWLRETGQVPVEVMPSGGGMYALVLQGIGKPGVPPGDLSREIGNVLRWRQELSEGEYAAKVREAGYLPLPASVPAVRSAETRAPVAAPSAPGVVAWEEAHGYKGRGVIAVEGRIVRTKRMKKVLYLNFHPNWKRYVTVVIFARDLRRFPPNPEVLYRGKVVRVRGEVREYKGRPEIVVRSPREITVLE